MTMAKRRHYFLDKRENVTRLWRGYVWVCLSLLLLDVVYSRHATHPWDSLWGFYAIFGFVGIVLLVLGAKQLRRMVMRQEDFYDDG
jgi:protein-S-isoprenylcysteine O-methyltransferase Ste14